MKKLIKNYTTEVPLEQTIMEIQQLLSQNGATGIAFDYDGRGKLKAVFFKIVFEGKELPFRLPAKPEQVYEALHASAPPHNHRRYGDQWRRDSERIAWRVCKLWLEAQITHINLDQVKPQEVFLPYLVMPNNRTLYETMEENKFLLPSGSGR
jgi:hypothetical protein